MRYGDPWRRSARRLPAPRGNELCRSGAGGRGRADRADRSAEGRRPADRPSHPARCTQRRLPRPREFARTLAHRARRGLGRWQPERRLAPAQRLRRQPARRHGTGSSTAPHRDGAVVRSPKAPFRTEDRHDAHREARSSHRGRRDHRCDLRERRSRSRRGPSTPRPIQTIIRRRDSDGLEASLDDASAGPVAGFARGLRADQAAVAAALRLPWRNARTEGRIIELKLVNRHM